MNKVYINTNNEQKLVDPTASDLKSNMEFRKFPYWDLYSIYLKATFPNDNTLYACEANLKAVLDNLKHDTSKLLYWFKINSISIIFQFMILHKISYQPQKLFVNTFTTDESDEVELLELSTDKELNFSKAIEKLCCYAQYIFHALRRRINYLNL